MKIIDLTGTIKPGIWSYGKPYAEVGFETIGAYQKQGWISHNINLSVLTGTYLETALHRIPGTRSIDEIKPEELIVDAVVVKTPTKKPLEQITVAELRPIIEKYSRPGNALLVHTGWERYLNKPQFIGQSPHFSVDAGQYLLTKNISILGGDMPCFDDPRGRKFCLVGEVFKKDTLVLSPLVNLGKIKQPRVKLIVLPLKLKGLSASPCRALAIEK